MYICFNGSNIDNYLFDVVARPNQQESP